jgi:type VI protein secretion system component Hcp
MAKTKILVIRNAALILSLTIANMLAGAAGAQTKSTGTGGYMRMVSASGRVMPGESTDEKFNGWIPLRQVTMPSPAEMTAMATQDPATAAKSVHPPIVVVKDRDGSSLGILGAFSGHKHFSEVDIAITDHSDRPAARYKLTDATVVAVRAGGSGDGTQTPMEQVRIVYAKIEAVQ